MYKSHVKHTVSLIQNKIFYVLQVYISLVHQVQQPAGCCNQYIHSFPEG